MYKKIITIMLFIFLFVFFQCISLYPAYFLNIHHEYIVESYDNYKVDYLTINENKTKFVYFENKKECPFVVYYHGNNELVDHHVGYFTQATKQNCIRVLLVEYNGYGSTDGFPSLESTLNNTIYWLKENNLENEKINVWGRSIGSAHAYHFLENFPHKVDNVIVHAGFLSPLNFFTENKKLVDILENFLLVNYNVEHKISNLTKNKDISVILFHGEKDHMFSVDVPNMVSELFNENNIKTSVYLYNGGHNLIPNNIFEIVNKKLNK
jgi:predicted esterase